MLVKVLMMVKRICVGLVIADADSIIPVARVLMLGASGVGKTSLCAKFLSSGNKNSYEPDCESVEMEVAQQQQ